MLSYQCCFNRLKEAKYLRKLGRKILYLYHIPTDPCLRFGFTGVLKIRTLDGYVASANALYVLVLSCPIDAGKSSSHNCYLSFYFVV